MDASAADDAAIRRCQQGYIDGLETLVKHHQVQALRLCFLLTGDHFLAEDIVQDSFMQAYARMHQFRLGQPFRPWFHRIVTNLARQRHRKASHLREISLQGWDPATDEIASDLPLLATSLTPVEEVERAEERAVILQALSLLTTKQREVVVLRYYLDYHEQEIAHILACSPNTVRQRLYSGLQALQRIIRRQFPTLLSESSSSFGKDIIAREETSAQ